MLISHGLHYEELFPSNLSEVEMEMRIKKIEYCIKLNGKTWSASFIGEKSAKS